MKITKRSRSLDIHGLSKNSFEGLHPLPERPEDLSTLADDLKLNDPFGPEESDALSSSTPSPPTTGRLSHHLFCDSSNSWSVGTGGNLTTGRSSVYSWGNDDEFDRRAAAQVFLMFGEVDNCLFENTHANGSSELNDECSDWNTSFPYLRLLGKQLLSIEETGTQIVIQTNQESNELSTVNNVLEDVEADASGSAENLTLSVYGHKVEAVAPPNISRPFPHGDDLNSSSSHPLSYLEEEIFAIDGEIEELIAYDNTSIDVRDIKDTLKKVKKNKYRAFPPVTPNAFVHDTTISECFDQVWIEIIHILKSLLKLYTHARARKDLERRHSHFYSHIDGYLDSALELPQSRDYYGRVPAIPSLLRYKGTNGTLNTSSALNSLKELMTIRSVALQHRAPSVASNMIHDDHPQPKEQSNSRPASSSVANYRQFPKTTTFRNAEQQFYDRMLSAKVPKRNNIRLLQPLQPPKTTGQVVNSVENNYVGEVRGTRLQTAGDRFSPGTTGINSQLGGARNKVLPPLEWVDTADTTFSVKEIRLKSPKRNNRSSSAVTNESKTFTVRERVAQSMLPNSRPNTTHSYRTETPYNNTKSTQPAKLRDSLHGNISKPMFHSHHHTINEHFSHFPEKSFGEGEEFDHFVLWGHGPPLISPQQRKTRK